MLRTGPRLFQAMLGGKAEELWWIGEDPYCTRTAQSQSRIGWEDDYNKLTEPRGEVTKKHINLFFRVTPPSQFQEHGTLYQLLRCAPSFIAGFSTTRRLTPTSVRAGWAQIKPHLSRTITNTQKSQVKWLMRTADSCFARKEHHASYRAGNALTSGVQKMTWIQHG